MSAMKSNDVPAGRWSITAAAMASTPAPRPATKRGLNTSRTEPRSRVWLRPSANSKVRGINSGSKGIDARTLGLASGSLVHPHPPSTWRAAWYPRTSQAAGGFVPHHLAVAAAPLVERKGIRGLPRQAWYCSARGGHGAPARTEGRVGGPRRDAACPAA